MRAVDNTARTRVAIAALGAIGTQIAKAVIGFDDFVLAAVTARNKDAARGKLASWGCSAPVVDVEELEPLADIVIECAPAGLFPEVVTPFLARGKTVIAMSAGALIAHGHLIELARCNDAQIILPSGGILGLDAVGAAAEGNIQSARLITRKPPSSLTGISYLIERGIDVATIIEPRQLFKGSARNAALNFPSNANVAAALALAGAGLDTTQVEIWADPTICRNSHTIHIESDAASFSMTIDNILSDNPRTSKIAALSAISCLRKLRAALRVGS